MAAKKVLKLLVKAKSGGKRVKYFKTQKSYNRWLKEGRGTRPKDGKFLKADQKDYSSIGEKAEKKLTAAMMKRLRGTPEVSKLKVSSAKSVPGKLKKAEKEIEHLTQRIKSLKRIKPMNVPEVERLRKQRYFLRQSVRETKAAMKPSKKASTEKANSKLVKERDELEGGIANIKNVLRKTQRRSVAPGDNQVGISIQAYNKAIKQMKKKLAAVNRKLKAARK